ncbi:MAG: DegQ family serine endoprotease [Gammaproteobacteria bacterium]|nr:DegQ family serine endoprotease [Gammaproteobacteria bacterium]
MRKSPVAAFAVFFCLLAIAKVQAAGLPDFRPIVKENTPAVVKILVEYSASGSGQRSARPLDNQEIPEYLRRFFEFRGAPPQQRQRQSMGSGFIISRDGYIVTNNHVVEGADSILVRLTDRREYRAEVVGLDARSDLALLRIEAEDLPVLQLGKPGELEVGEWVLAIGSPFGLDYSVTAGIVSAKGRSLPTESNGNYVPFIQTDVAINPGNSGGPLFNLDGEVVGVNSQIYTRSGGSIGLSFAIPVSVVINVVEQLKQTGHVTRGWLGVTIQNVDKNLAESFGLDRPRGALISQLQPGGPAEKGGLQPGDVILRFDGAEIHTSSDLPHVVGLTRPGTRVSIEVMREGSAKTLKMAVGGLDADEEPSILADSAVGAGGGRLGLVVEEIDDQLQSRWGITGGVVVTEVVPQGPGDRAGMLRGDVVTLIGSYPITSVAAYTRAAERLQAGKSVPMRIIRRGAPLFIGLKLD